MTLRRKKRRKKKKKGKIDEAQTESGAAQTQTPKQGKPHIPVSSQYQSYNKYQYQEYTPNYGRYQNDYNYYNTNDDDLFYGKSYAKMPEKSVYSSNKKVTPVIDFRRGEYYSNKK